ncbi:P-loop containing nucleoside triphosphate hydrolase [Hirsutella rhossiliensis]|uniref:P-loop containing nucleoside triphosphate hydrolase n=1 Tax=Hirsutella rhossiliensis TaxID=111463 RepID=A0A9P8MPI8_9HYPO|nr:P-loop containing nucleoside triphosphate hydrolase [Hirsutella rhossiliensis]KAH0958154.1 P-loop containing nucleoside triphosphate hydrolase [Hirsutella rhossiliensis]
MSTHAASPPLRHYLLSYPRTASNLVVKILHLDSQPSVSSGELDGGYFFMRADDMLIEPHFRTKSVADWTSEERSQVQKCYQGCFDDMRTWLDSQHARGQCVFVKEHTTFLARPEERSRLVLGTGIHGAPLTVEDTAGSTWSDQNFTVLPDEFLQTWLPTFLIRHPALAFPSYYRTIVKMRGNEGAAADDYASFMTSVQWSRQLHDLYLQWRDKLPCSADKRDVWPIVLDADDVISSPDTMTLYCHMLDMDPAKLRFTWDELKQNHLLHMAPCQQVMRSTLLQSTGVIKAKAQSEIDIADEAEKWKTEFGAGAAQRIAKMVREAMPDYEYLRAKRLRADA